VRATNVTDVGVPDELVMAGERPVTWLTALELWPLGEERFTTILRQARTAAANLLTMPDAGVWYTVPPLVREQAEVPVEFAIANAYEDVVVTAHGVLAALRPDRDPRQTRARMDWLTVEVSWTVWLADDCPDKGDIVLQQITCDRGLAGVAQAAVEPRLRQELREGFARTARTAQHC